MKISLLTEATRPYIEKIIDPALMTFDEYYKMVNSEDKFHPSSAYQTTIEDLNADWRGDPRESYSNLINNIIAKGLEFEIRENKLDRWEGKYTKVDEDNRIVRDENNNAMYYNKDEIKLIIPEDKRFRYDYAIVRKDTGELIGVTQDEWGTLLVMVAAEYRKFGFGTMLVKLAREKKPDRPSGGFTRSGYENFKRVHAQMVRNYMESGFYSYLVKNEIISAGKAKAIINSIKVDRPKKDNKNLSSNDPNNYLVMTDGSSYAVMYDKNILKLDFDADDYWVETFIKGFISIGGTNKNMIWIEKTYGTNQIVSKLLEIILTGELGEKILMEKDEFEKYGNIKGIQTENFENRIYVWLTNPNINVNKLIYSEKKVRKPHDPYDEIKYRIHELAEQMANY